MTSCCEVHRRRGHWTRTRCDGAMAPWLLLLLLLLLLLVIVVVVVVVCLLVVVVIERRGPVAASEQQQQWQAEAAGGSRSEVVRSRRQATKVPCRSLPRELLRKILGPAYNPRYMSIEKPETPPDVTLTSSGSRSSSDTNWQHQQRHHDKGQPERHKVDAFHVHQGYTRILYDEPVQVYGELEDDSTTDTLTSTSPSASLLTTTTAAPYGRLDHKINKDKRPRSRTSILKGHKRKSHKDHQQEEQQQKLRFLKEEEFEQVEPPVPPHLDASPHSDAASLPDARQMQHMDAFLRTLPRSKRQVKDGFPWACDSRIEWLDLGPNHFPRFLRSVVCTSGKCWFGHFQCRPKAFTVKILRRRKDSCIVPSSSAALPSSPLVNANDDTFDANSLVPPEFREQWAFEERAVTFCCECAA